MPGQIKVTLVRSLIGQPEKTRRVAWALGLNKVQSSRLHYDSPQIRGMLRRVQHLVRVEEV